MASETRVRRGAVAGAVRAGRRRGAARPRGVRRLRGLARRDGRRARGARPQPGPVSPARHGHRDLGAARSTADDEPKADLLPRIAAGEVADPGHRRAGARRRHCGDGAARSDDGALEVRRRRRRRAGRSLDQTLAPGPRSPDGGGPWRRPAPGRRLGADLRPPGRRRPARARHDGGLQQGAGAVRPADRLVPGAQAPDGRHARARRGVPVGVVGGDGCCRGVRPGTRRSSTPRSCRVGRPWRAPTAPTRWTTSPPRPCSCTAASRSPGSTTPSWCSSARTR